MVWLEGNAVNPMSAGQRFDQLLVRGGILRMPGAHDALAGLLAKDAGFSALYLSGGALSASMGLPDLGIMTMEELCSTAEKIIRATGLPLLVDGDTGYGEALNVMRLVHELENIGAAAVHIEDQVLPKKCGHLNDKILIDPEAMAAKIAAAVKARLHLKIIARTDAFATEGLAGLIERARRYLDAGADAIFPEALTTAEEFQQVAESLKCPLLANMTEFGRTPHFTAEEFESFGYQMLIWPVSSLRIAAGAMDAFYHQLAEDGTTEPQLTRMLTRKRLYELIGYHDFEDLDQAIIKTLL